MIGRRVPRVLLDAVLDEPAGPAILDLVDRGFLVDRVVDGDVEERDVLSFSHALVQEAAYLRLLKRQQRAMHLRVADAAEALFGSDGTSVDLLARHLYLARAGERAVACLMAAADRARGVFANEDALTHLSRALELLEDPGSDPIATADLHLPVVLTEIGELRETLGEYEPALDAFQRALASGAGIRAWRGVAAALRLQSRYDEALEVIERARTSVPGDDHATLALEAGWTLSRAGRMSDALKELDAGLTAATDDIVRAELLLQRARALTAIGDAPAAISSARAAVEILEFRESLVKLTTALRILGDGLRSDRRLDEAADVLRRGLALAEMVGRREEQAGCLVNLGIVELERERWDDAAAFNRRAIDVFRTTGNTTGEAIALGNLADTYGRAGRSDEALAVAAEGLAFAERIGDTETIADIERTLARVFLAQGDRERALASASRAAAGFAEVGAEADAAECRTLAGEAARA